MPKKTLKVDGFSGGINNAISERDLEGNQSPSAVNAEIEDEGTLKICGTANLPYLDFNNTITISTPGSGMFSFAHDYDMIDSGALKTPAQVNTDYLVKENNRTIAVYDHTNGEWFNVVTLDSGGGTCNPIFYVADGGLRIMDAGAVTKPAKIITHVGKDMFVQSGGTAGFSINKWWAGTAFPLPLKKYGTGSGDEGGETDDDADYNSNTNNSGAISFQLIDDQHFDAGAGSSNDKWYIEPAEDCNGILVRANLIDYSQGGSNNATWKDTDYTFYATALFDRTKQESSMIEIGSITAGDFNSDYCALQMAVQVQPWGGNDAVATSMKMLSDRMTGIRIYYTEDKDAYSERYLLLDVDFEKGCKKSESSIYEPWGAAYNSGSGTANAYCCPNESMNDTSNNSGFIFTDPPVSGTYNSENGHFNTEETRAIGKSVAVGGRRVYIGNVYQNGKQQNDLMLKSAKGQFDKFPELNKVEAAVNDGEEITHLEAFGDRILQFKKRTLYIINVAGDVEFTESKHAFMGAEKPYQVCKGPGGVYWINSIGLFRYDGEKVLPLSDGKIRRVKGGTTITNAWDWDDMDPAIGYDEKNHKIIIIKNVQADQTTSTDLWIYNVRLNAWTEGKNLINKGAKSNFVNNLKDGELLFSISGAASSVTYSFGPGTNDSFVTYNLPVIHFGSEGGEFQGNNFMNVTFDAANAWNGDGPTAIFETGDFFTFSNSLIKLGGTSGTDMLNGYKYQIRPHPTTMSNTTLSLTPASTNGANAIENITVTGSNNIMSKFKALELTKGGGEGLNTSNYSDAGNTFPDAGGAYVTNWVGTSTHSGYSDRDFAHWLKGNTGNKTFTLTDNSSGSAVVWTLKVLAGTDNDATAIVGSFVGMLSVSEGVGKDPTNASAQLALGMGNILKWDNIPYKTGDFLYETKDIDFGNPATLKRIKKVYVTFKTRSINGSYLPSNVEAKLIAVTPNGSNELLFEHSLVAGSNYRTTDTHIEGYTLTPATTLEAFKGFMYAPNGLANTSSSSGMDLLDDGTNLEGSMIASLIPKSTYVGGASVGDIYSCKLQFFSSDGKDSAAGFEVNDITIVYREKSVK